jgi:general secretion pathway protein N
VGGGDGAASSDLQLTGVIMLPDLKMAILHDKSSNKDYRVIEGRPARGAPALVELHPRSAVVEASGSRVSLQLIPGPSPGAGQGDTRQPAESGNQDGSAMVTRQGDDSGWEQPTASAAARARQLKARIQAGRRAAGGGHGD